MPFLQVDGANLYWKRDGLDCAPALILLNSIGTDMDLWDGVLPALRQEFAILRMDARGHGASSADPGDLSLKILAEDVLNVADAAGFGTFALAGVSLGGMIGMELALTAPCRVDQLALVCTSAVMDASAWAERTEMVRREGMAAIAEVVMARFLSNAADVAIRETVRRQLMSMSVEGYAACAAAIRDMDLCSRLPMIDCPTLIITGSRDSSTPFEGHGEHLLSTIPGARHISLPAAHLAPLEAPDAVSAALLNLIVN